MFFFYFSLPTSFKIRCLNKIFFSFSHCLQIAFCPVKLKSPASELKCSILWSYFNHFFFVTQVWYFSTFHWHSSSPVRELPSLSFIRHKCWIESARRYILECIETALHFIFYMYMWCMVDVYCFYTKTLLDFHSSNICRKYISWSRVSQPDIKPDWERRNGGFLDYT